MLALFVNAAILIVAAAVFHAHGKQVAEIDEAYNLLSPLLGVGIASVLFAVALLASGVNSTVTATLAGQIVMEGFLDIRLPPKLPSQCECRAGMVEGREAVEGKDGERLK